MKTITLITLLAVLALPAAANPFFFSTGDVTNNIAIATRPATGPKFEIEGADDFVLGASHTLINSATFTGLLTGGATASDISQVVVEIYRVFPLDSNVARTSGPPTFSTSQVPTRVNSPSDVAFDSRDSGSAGLTFGTVLSATLDSLNSVLPGGIHPQPGQTTGGNGPARGTEVEIDVTFATAFDLPSGHYFFVPQVAVGTANGEFLWLSGTRPIVSPGTPFAPDLQSWTRDQFLDPDWLRVGTDIVGGTPAPTFNGAFTLNGTAIPEPSSLVPLGVLALVFGRRLRRMVA